MMTGVKIEKQGDGSYEVLFDDGSRYSAHDFREAVQITENRLYPVDEEPETLQEHSVGDAICTDMDNGCSIWSQPCGNT